MSIFDPVALVPKLRLVMHIYLVSIYLLCALAIRSQAELGSELYDRYYCAAAPKHFLVLVL
ncbi:MAG: hypothetical protein K0Q67_3044 [Cellvibrio sp.]|nr:hypothetical protein [Cellvibrio sp.]